MSKNEKTKKVIRTIIKLVVLFSLCCFFSIYSSVDLDINLFAYIGTMMAFAITIFTFGINTIAKIKELINVNGKRTESKKKAYLEALLSSFYELKDDVWAIAYSLMVLILVVLIQSLGDFNLMINDFLSQYKTIGRFNLYYTLKLFTFILSTWMFIDLVRSILGISQILIELTKEDSFKDNKDSNKP